MLVCRVVGVHRCRRADIIHNAIALSLSRRTERYNTKKRGTGGCYRSCVSNEKDEIIRAIYSLSLSLCVCVCVCVRERENCLGGHVVQSECMEM